MSRLSGDRNSQQQLNQNQPIVQSSSQQNLIQAVNSSAGSFIIINSNSPNDGIPRTPLNNVNTSQNSISYSIPSVAQPASVVHNLPANVQSTFSPSTPTSHSDSGGPIAIKRLKLDIVESSSSCGSTNTIEDLLALKARILEHKFLRLKGLIEK